MAGMHRLSSEQVGLDQTLPWDVYDSGGNLLLRKGFLLERDDQVAMLLERGLFVDASEYSAHVASKQPVRYDALSLWENVQAHLAFISESLPRDGSLQGEITRLARQVMQLTERSPDLILAAILLLDHRNYPIAHCVHSALIADLVAHAAHWEKPERISLICAALSMNISMLDLQARLFNQKGSPTPEQRKQLNEHPAESARLLISCGVDDDEWLRAVLEHHETPDGLGYPRKVKNPSEAAMLLHTADVFSAKLSPRSHRQPMIASEATKAVFTRLAHQGKNPFPAMLVKELGIYPPGAIVKLVNGETGVVYKRGPNAKSPVVAVLINANGMSTNKTLIRNTAEDPATSVGMALSRDKMMLSVNFRQIWAE